MGCCPQACWPGLPKRPVWPAWPCFCEGGEETGGFRVPGWNSALGTSEVASVQRCFPPNSTFGSDPHKGNPAASSSARALGAPAGDGLPSLTARGGGACPCPSSYKEGPVCAAGRRPSAARLSRSLGSGVARYPRGGRPTGVPLLRLETLNQASDTQGSASEQGFEATETGVAVKTLQSCPSTGAAFPGGVPGGGWQGEAGALTGGWSQPLGSPRCRWT